MKTKAAASHYCELTKEEPLSTLEPEMTYEKTCVLESTSPFFGYYNDAHVGKPEPYIYLVLEQHYFYGDIYRAALQVNTERRNPFDAAHGVLITPKQTCPVIRIKGIEHYTQVRSIQEGLFQHGIRFKPCQRAVKDQMTIIRIALLLPMVEIDDNLYLDGKDHTKGFFELPAFLSWDNFKLLTYEVKNDISIMNFDAAQLFMYDGVNVRNMLRIYKENIDPEVLQVIRDPYLKILDLNKR